MQRIAVSILSLFVVFPAIADARLPMVDLNSGGISARAAFGESVIVPVHKTRTSSVTRVKTPNIAKTDNSSAKKVVSRPTVNATDRNVSVDNGGQVMVSATDVLSPRRPSADLWAHSDNPLRMPKPDEFSVFRPSYDLPEESLDGRVAQSINNTSYSVAQNVPVAPSAPTVMTDIKPMSELDAQIARLNELQRRADNDARAAEIAPEPVPVRTFAAAKVENNMPVSHSVGNKGDDVVISRMVVPMDSTGYGRDSDVIVRKVERFESPRIATVRDDMTKMSPTELRKAFRKTFLSENKHLSTYPIDERFDVASDMSENVVGFTAQRDLSENTGIRPLEIKIKFRNDDSALSRANYNLLTKYAGIVLTNPTRAVQVSIPQRATLDADDRKLAARRLAIVEQVLRDNGIAEYRILPVLSQRDEEVFVLRMISSEQYETLTQQQRNMSGKSTGKKTYKSMSW